MSPKTASRKPDGPELPPSPFRTAFGQARVEAQGGPAPARELRPEAASGTRMFEYRLVKRRGKRSAEEAAWNKLGRAGWELVALTGEVAAFERPIVAEVSA